MSNTLGALANVLEAVRSTTSRLEKRRHLVDYLRAVPDEALPLAVTFLCGRPFPRFQNRILSAGGAAFSAALMAAQPGLTPDRLNAAWLTHSDASDTAFDLWQGYSPVPPPLTLSEMAELFETLAVSRGPTGKVPRLAQAFQRMDATGLKAFVKVLLGGARIGAQEGTIEDAVANAFDQPLETVRAANRHRADLGAVALEARHNRLQTASFTYFVPVDPMLAHPVSDPAEACRRIPPPIWTEDKFDGIRCQLHKDGPAVRLFSRDRKDISRQFPEVVAGFATGEERYALDGELMALENGRSLPFARLQQRLNRVAPTEAILKQHPAAMVAFDLLAIGDESLLDHPLSERRQHLDRLVFPPGQVRAVVTEAHTVEDLDRLFAEAQARGNEGLMCKDARSVYASGRRGYQWLKVKRPLDALDTVVVGAEWGHGKRRGVLSDYTFAVKDDANDRLVTIGKAYGGLTDVEIAEMTERLKAITLAEYGRFRTVKPEIVLEIEFNNIQRSSRHKSGFALRFPRIVRIRRDKTAAEINTLADVESMYRALSGEPEP